MRQQSGRGGRTRGDHVAGGRRGGGDRRQRDDGEDGEDRGAGRGGGRGGGRGRGDGEYRGRGGRGRGGGGDGEHGSGGRGRGGGRARMRNQGADFFYENEGQGTVDTAEAGGYRERYGGKAREDWHPMDRASGTGRGKGDRKKGGGGRGDWGDETKPIEEGEEEKKGEGEDNEESKGKRERKPRREEEKVEESEEEEGFTYEDYLAQQQAKNKNLPTAQGRKHEKVEDKNRLEEFGIQKQKTTGIDNNLAGRDTHKMTGGTGAELLGFGAAKDDDDFGDRRGRGGRGRGRDDRGPRGGDRGGRGGRRGRGGKDKPVFDEDAFPAL